MTSILLIAEPADAVRQSLSRALMLARYLHARIDIVFFDAGRPYTPRSSAAPQATAHAHQYLQALRASVTAPDVAITTDGAFEGFLPEYIAQKVVEQGAELVIKAAGHRRMGHSSRIDWQLIRSCPAPLLLTQGRAWHPRPRFAAAIDILDRRTPNLPVAIAQTSSWLRGACGADLTMMYAQTQKSSAMVPGEESPAQLRLRQLGLEFAIDPQDLHMLSGNANEALPRFAGERAYDLVAVGVSDRSSFPEFVGSLSGQLLRATDCDVLIVKPGSYSALQPAKAMIALET
jgi:universal stress protein E